MKKAFVTETTCAVMFDPMNQTYVVNLVISDIPSEENAMWVGEQVMDAVRKKVIEIGGNDLGDEPPARRDQ